MIRKFYFRKSLTVFLLLFICVPVLSQQLSPGIQSSADLFYTGQEDGVSCYRIPALITAANGDLIAAIDERVPSCNDLRGSKDINIIIRRSFDSGQTWSGIERVIDFPEGQSASDPSMILDEETGKIFLFYNYMDLVKEFNIYKLHVVESADNGATWSTPRDITSQITKPEWREDFMFITSGRGSQTKDGTLLHTLVNLDHGLHLFASDDHGESWYLLDTPIAPGDESKVLELNDGSWMINSRVNNQKKRVVHLSDDQGKSWKSEPSEELIDPSCNASIIRYKYDEYNLLLFSNAKSDEGRKNMTVRYSKDEGATWSEGKTIYTGPAAYSTMTVLEDGSIGLLFEKDEYTKNTFVRFPLSWLLDQE